MSRLQELLLPCSRLHTSPPGARKSLPIILSLRKILFMFLVGHGKKQLNRLGWRNVEPGNPLRGGWLWLRPLFGRWGPSHLPAKRLVLQHNDQRFVLFHQFWMFAIEPRLRSV